MNTFLKLVAKSLLAPFEGEQMIDLSKIIIIFPNKRAMDDLSGRLRISQSVSSLRSKLLW